MISTIYKKISSPLGGLGDTKYVSLLYYILFYFFEGGMVHWFIITNLTKY